MQATLGALVARLDEIRDFIRSADQANALAYAANGAGLIDRHGDPIDTLVSALLRGEKSRRQFVYSAVMVSLYGAFESYAEALAMEFLVRIDSSCPSFEDLPQAVRENHLDATSRLLLRRNIDKYRDRVDLDEVVGRLGRAGEPAGVRRVNELAFIDHVSNFRAESLNEFFAHAGVSGLCQKMKQCSVFQGFMLGYSGLEGLERLENKVVFEDLDGLAQRRNEVAHGMASSLLSTRMMLERAEFVQAVGEAMHDVVNQEALKTELSHLSTPLPEPIVVYDKHIVCMRLEATRLAVGMTVAAKAPNGRLVTGQIQSIQVNNIDVSEVAAPPAVNVGFRVPFETKATHEFFRFS